MPISQERLEIEVSDSFDQLRNELTDGLALDSARAILDRARYLASELELRERELRRQQLDVARREQAMERDSGSSELVSPSLAMEKVYSFCSAIASTNNATVLLTGEGGVGKEFIAKKIHSSAQKHGPFKSIHCGALPEVLLEGELFGHATDQQGLLETAKGGTLYLNEIGDLSSASQVKLLRVLQEREIWPIGAAEPHDIDVQIVLGTNHDLEKLVEAGRFRTDLYYFLIATSINIPALRNRREEILPLARKFIQVSCERGGLNAKVLTASAAEALGDHSWPGNIRELQTAIERAVILSGAHNSIQRDHLSPAIRSGVGNLAKMQFDEVVTIAELERRYTLEVLDRYNGNRTRTAKALGIGANTLWRKLKSWGVPPARGEQV